jgi:hypothetical protein
MNSRIYALVNNLDFVFHQPVATLSTDHTQKILDNG